MSDETRQTQMIETLATVAERTKNIDSRLTRIESSLNEQYVTQTEFKPVRAIVYGFVGLVLLAVIGGIVTLVIPSKSEPKAKTKPTGAAIVIKP